MDFLFFILGCSFIWLGGNFVVDSASHIARRFNISELIIGLTLVSIGTSLPEVVVNVVASLKKETTVVIGNILGSNISNTLLIIGITGLICPLVIPKTRLKKEVLFYIFSVFLLSFLIFISSLNRLGLFQGCLLIGLFILSLFMFFNGNKKDVDQDSPVSKQALIITCLLFLLGCILLPAGGSLLVDSAVNIAISLGISKAFISLFAVALGTSLPELITSIVAARKGNSSLAIGNIVGSNIFNLTLVLGISSLIYPIIFEPLFQIDLLVVGICFLPIFFVLIFGKKAVFSKKFCFFMLLFYTMYMCFVYYR